MRHIHGTFLGAGAYFLGCGKTYFTLPRDSMNYDGSLKLDQQRIYTSSASIYASDAATQLAFFCILVKTHRQHLSLQFLILGRLVENAGAVQLSALNSSI